MSFHVKKRSALRTLAVGGTLVATLATAASASAALGGGPAAQFTNRPNLQSVTFNGIIGSYTFDVPVQAGPNFDDEVFKIGGYSAGVANRNSTTSTANVSVSDPKTVLVTFNGNEGVDFDANTFGAVGPGAVRGLGTFGEVNFQDATSITGANGENGTAGHTVGPDLQSVSIDSSNNRITYTYDQEVSEAEFAPNPAQFGFLNVNGDARISTGIVDVDGADVTAQFGGAPVNDVDNARQGVVGTGSARSIETGLVGADVANVNVPGKNPLTAAPSLVSTALEPNTGTIVYTFDQMIAGTVAGNFQAIRSNSVISTATSATVVNGNQVRATFPQTSIFIEHVVHAGVRPGGVIGANAVPNTFTGKPAGGNVGAKATGYTTAPDAIGATVNQAAGQASVLFDSRILEVAGFPLVDADEFSLISDDGTVIAPAAATAAVIQSSGPSQARVVLQYTPQQLAVADYIRVDGNRVDGGGGYDTNGANAAVFGTITNGALVPDAQNVRTILDPTAITTTFKVSK